MPNGITFTGEFFFKELSDLIKEKYQIQCDPQSISDILKGLAKFENTQHKCNFELSVEFDKVLDS